MTKYFRILADHNIPDRWFLRSPIASNGDAIDPSIFTENQVQQLVHPLALPVRRGGAVVDFNFADFDMPVLRSEIVDRLREFGGIPCQSIPVSIPDMAAEFEILNVLDEVDCIDAAESVYTRWLETDGRHDKVGQYRMIVRLRVDAGLADGHHMFRLKGWNVALVVSEQVKDLLEKLGVSGIAYQSLN